MKIWIYIEGRQDGPYTLEELLDKPVDEHTMVWFEGLPKWYPAGYLDELKPLFDGSLAAGTAIVDNAAETEKATCASEGAPVEETANGTSATESENAEPHTTSTWEPAATTSRYAPGQRYNASRKPEKPCPPTYIGWSIFLTICCCSPVSLAGLIASICVSTYYNGGNLDKARKASEVAAWLVMIAFALGMIPVMLMSALF